MDKYCNFELLTYNRKFDIKNKLIQTTNVILRPVVVSTYVTHFFS